MSRALGRYELLRPLARGGMGEVFLARRRAAGVEKWLVVKRMRPERAGDARFLDLFMREAKLTMSLAHQNIVPVFDFGRIDDQVFLAMERIEGKDLGSALAKAGGGLSPQLAAFIAAECCQALDYAHRRRGPDGAPLGIVHRDVTPRNVLLSWSGEVKLTDFGIAALAGDAFRSAVGTPAYMAPEQARGEPTDVRADVAAKKGDSPARQLAGWLDSTWEEEREEGAIDEAIEADNLVSFLDDGALDILGTGTQRSMVATAADEGPPRIEVPKVEPPVIAPPPVAAEASRPTPAPRSRAWLLGLLALPLAAVVVFVATRSHDEPVERPAPAPPPAHVEAQPTAPSPPTAPVEHGQPPVEVKQPVIVEGPKPTKIEPRKAETRKLAVKAAAGSAASPAPVVKHKVMIGSQPWSYFTVDGGSEQFESNNPIELTEGPHTIHFVGQGKNFHADKTITIRVPDQLPPTEKLVEIPAP